MKEEIKKCEDCGQTEKEVSFTVDDGLCDDFIEKYFPELLDKNK